MILLDTNVVSEPLRPKPAESVVQWLDAQSSETLYLSCITVAELRAGVAIMPTGKRRKLLDEALENHVLPLFAGRVLPFDASCTRAYASLIARARSSGYAISAADGFIAATAAENAFAVATRDTDPFEAAGVQTINPWGTESGPS